MYCDREILHNECGCLFANGVKDNECLKRYYVIFDYEKSQRIKISICNEYLRLKVAEYKHNNNDRIITHHSMAHILSEIFSEYVNIYNGVGYLYYHNQTIDLHKYQIQLPLCERPNINLNMPILDAIECVRVGNRWFNNIHKVLLEQTLYYLDNHVKNKVSRSKFEKSIKLANTISKEWDSELREIKMNELFISIFELK